METDVFPLDDAPFEDLKVGGRCWLRTNDLLGVSQALSPSELTVHSEARRYRTPLMCGTRLSKISTDHLHARTRVRLRLRVSGTKKARVHHPGPCTFLLKSPEWNQGGCSLKLVAGIAMPGSVARRSCCHASDPTRYDRPAWGLRYLCVVMWVEVGLNQKGPGSRS